MSILNHLNLNEKSQESYNYTKKILKISVKMVIYVTKNKQNIYAVTVVVFQMNK